MITIYVSPGLIDKMLRTGSEVSHTRILTGLPDGASLLNVRLLWDGSLVALEFFDPLPGPDREITVTLQTMSRPPSPLHPLVQLDQQLQEGSA